MSNEILQIISHQMIPWIETHGIDELVVARQTFKETAKKSTFSFTPRNLQGPRKGVRSFTFNLTTAGWPNDHMIESSAPILTYITEGEADIPFGNYWIHAQKDQAVFGLARVPRKDGTIPYLLPKNYQNGFCSTINISEVRGGLHVWCNSSWGKIHDKTKGIKPIFTIDSKGLELLHQLQYWFELNEPANEQICQSLLQSLLYTLLHDIKAGRTLEPGKINSPVFDPNETYNPLTEAKTYVTTHLQEPLTLQHVADHVRLSRTQFATQFKKETGQTFNQFVTQVRMEQAKVLLAETNYTLTFVQKSIGYSSYTYFYRLFFRYFGFSPQEYRQKQRQIFTNNKDTS